MGREASAFSFFSQESSVLRIGLSHRGGRTFATPLQYRQTPQHPKDSPYPSWRSIPVRQMPAPSWRSRFASHNVDAFLKIGDSGIARHDGSNHPDLGALRACAEEAGRKGGGLEPEMAIEIAVPETAPLVRPMSMVGCLAVLLCGSAGEVVRGLCSRSEVFEFELTVWAALSTMHYLVFGVFILGAGFLLHRSAEVERTMPCQRETPPSTRSRFNTERRCLRGPFLGAIGGAAFPARRAGRSRATGVRQAVWARRRRALMRWLRRRRRRPRRTATRSAAATMVHGDVLRGGAGGAAAKRRKRTEQSMVLASLTAISRRLDTLEGNSVDSRRAKPGRAPASRQTKALPEHALNWAVIQPWIDMLSLPANAEMKKQILDKLGVKTTASGPSGATGHQPCGEPSAPAALSPAGKPRWADLFDKPEAKPSATTSTIGGASATKMQLYAPGWAGSPKITGMQGARSAADGDALVVLVRNAADHEEAELLAAARKGGTTIVWPKAAGAVVAPQMVLVDTNRGPVQAAAAVTRVGEGAPQQAVLEAENDDLGATADVTVDTWRLTCVKEFAEPALFSSVRVSPNLIPLKVLDSKVCEHVLRTKAIAVYEGDVTCLISARSDQKSVFEKAVRQLGVVLAPHHTVKDRATAPRPQWMVRPPGASAAEYWKQVADAALAAKGTLAYRPGGGSNLGVIGDIAREGAQPPAWTLTGTPSCWQRADVMEWATARGMTIVTGVSRRADRAWAMRAWPPAKASVTAVVSYSSGIILAPARAAKSKPQSMVATARPSWGPPKEPAAARRAPLATGDAQMVAKPGAVQQSTQLYADLPGRECFEPVDCGGAGDCAYLSVARALDYTNNGKASSGEADIVPGCAIVRKLRLWAAEDIRKHRSDYQDVIDPTEFAKTVVKDGEWADSVSLLALARALKIELRILSRSPADSQWHQYILRGRPEAAKSKKPAMVVWLALEAEHYRWLRVAGTVAEARLPKPIHLTKDKLPSLRTTRASTARAPADAATCILMEVDAVRGCEPDTKKQKMADSLGGGGRASSAVASHRAASVATSRRTASVDSAAVRRRLGLASSTAGTSQPSEVPQRSAGQQPKHSRADDDAASSRAVRRRLGLGAASAIATLADLAQDSADGAIDRRREVRQCSCGWLPPAGLSSIKRLQATRRHASECQGVKPSKLTPEEHAYVLKEVHKRNRMNANQKVNSDRQKHAAWLRTLTPEWRKAAHQPDFETVAAAVPGKCYTYSCAQCHSIRNVSRFKETPCSQRPLRTPGRGLEAWRAEVLGFDMDRLQKARDTNRVEQAARRRTEKGKAEQTRRGQNRLARQKAARQDSHAKEGRAVPRCGCKS